MGFSFVQLDISFILPTGIITYSAGIFKYAHFLKKYTSAQNSYVSTSFLIIIVIEVVNVKVSV